jgi:hypothetical protein
MEVTGWREPEVGMSPGLFRATAGSRASTMSNPARMKIAHASGESPLRVAVVVERTAPRTFPIQ